MHHDVGGRPVGQHGARNFADDLCTLVAELSVPGERDDVFPQRVEEPLDRRRVGNGPEPGISPLRSRVDDPYDTAVSAPGLAAAVSALDPWNQRVGLVWAEVLRACGLDLRGTVAEVGPGFTDKVGHGLADLGFSGTIALIEPTTSARNWACERYRGLLPDANVVGVPSDVRYAASWTGANVDAVVANHVLDDMLLHAAVDPHDRDALFDGMRPDIPCAGPFVRAWSDLMADVLRLERARITVVDEFARYVAATRPRIVAIREYASWTHRASGLAFIHGQSVRVRNDLAAALRDVGFDDLHVADRHRLLEPSEWLLMAWAR
jgi:hypothetical protein